MVRDRKQVMVSFDGDEQELYALLDQYRRSIGWTWKRFLLIGVAEAIAKQGDNPDIVLEIAKYLEGKR
jgi:hypothetical protein